MRTYQRTHPWITFAHNLQDAPYRVWLLLGDVQAKCDYISRTASPPDFGNLLRSITLAKGAHATTAIEGNTLTEEQVRKILNNELHVPPSQQYLEQQITNIENGFNLIGNRILKGDVRLFSPELFSEYNRIILQDLPLEPHVVPGQFRTYSVRIIGSGYEGAPPEDCEYLMAKLSDWLNDSLPASKGYDKAMDILRALIAHLYIAWIHPFGDGSGRTARLVEFKILLQAGLPDIAVHLLSNHYNLTRDEYYRQLAYASDSGGDIFRFLEYALQGFVDGLQSQIDVIFGAQYEVHWRDYIHRRFDDLQSAVDTRKKHLVLDLAMESIDSPYPIAKLRELSPRIAVAYAGKSDKTIRRDISDLADMRLIVVTNKTIAANLSVLNSFLPRRVIKSE